MQFKANTRKFENKTKKKIFELACGPGSRKFENHKFTDCLRKYADFCDNLSIVAKIYRFLRKFAYFFAKICRFLRKFADFCENLHIFFGENS